MHHISSRPFTVLAEFIESGLFYTHIRRCRKAYSMRLEAFLTAMQRHRIPLEFPFTDGGMNQTGYFTNDQSDAERASANLLAAGFDVPPLSQYSMSNTRPGLVFGFTAFQPKIIQTAVARLADVMHDS